MTEGQLERRRDDGGIKIPRAVVVTLGVAIILAIPTSIATGAWYMSHQSDSITRLAETFDRLEKTVDSFRQLSTNVSTIQTDVAALKADVKDRNTEAALRLKDADTYERSVNDRLTIMEAQLRYFGQNIPAGAALNAVGKAGKN